MWSGVEFPLSKNLDDDDDDATRPIAEEDEYFINMPSRNSNEVV